MIQPPHGPKKAPSHSEDLHFLDSVSKQSIKTAQKRLKAWFGYQATYYSSLANQRAQIFEELKNAIRIRAITSYDIHDWCRVVRYRWTLLPLSTRGSVEGNIGGRFNIGTGIDPVRFPVFPALYLAEQSETAISEVFGTKTEDKELSVFDQALARADSFSLVKVRGMLESVFDLRQKENLKPFFDLIRNIKFPKDVVKRARELELPVPHVVRTVSELYDTLLEENWRWHPMQCDIPSNSQIFGQIVETAGLDGIAYPSAKETGNCMVIFVRNFQDSNSWIELADTPPDENVIRRLDSATWQALA